MTVLEARMVDATHLELAEPVDLPPGRKLVISVVEVAEEPDERRHWLAASEATLQAAYSDSEPASRALFSSLRRKTMSRSKVEIGAPSRIAATPHV